MNCSLDRDKTKKAINLAVRKRIEKSNLFKINGENIILNQIPDNQPLTKEQVEGIEKSLEFKDNIKGAYKNSFLKDPEKFLREIAEQANSSSIEQGGALSVAGPELFDIAVNIFPNEGKNYPGLKLIDEINKEFKDDVLIPSGENTFKIQASDKLTLSYIMMQPGSKDIVLEAYREYYISQFSKDSLNLMQPEMWINHPILQNPSIQLLINFAKKINPNFNIGVVENLDQKAVSLIRDNIILIRNGHIIDELPEEISHFFVELLPEDHPLKISMLKDIINYPIYTETFEKYKNNPLYQKDGKVNIDKIKREASAKLIGEYIKESWAGTADKKYGKKRGIVRSIVDKLMSYLRKAISNITGNVYTEPLFDINSPFKDAANKIMSENISDLNIKKIPNIHDSIFFSAVDENMTNDIDNISKQMFQLAKATSSQLRKIYAERVNNSKYIALKEILNDEVHKDFNKIFNIIQLLDESAMYITEADTLSEALNPKSKKNQELEAIRQSSLALAESYREIGIIPDAINKVLDKMERDIRNKIDSPLAKSIDNLKELQLYFQFSNSFKKISTQFTTLLGQVRKDFEVNNYGAQRIYDDMMDHMGKTRESFEVADKRIMGLLQEHTINVMMKWTDNAFTKYRDEIIKRFGLSKFEETKKQLKKRLTDKVTSPEQIRNVLMGNFMSIEDAKEEDIDLSKIKDASQVDYLISLFSSASLSEDPFISNLMAFYTDEYVAGSIRGQRNALLFANKILPIKSNLKSKGFDYYEAELLIQDEEDFYAPYKDEKKIRRRILLSPVKRHKFNYDLKLIDLNIDKLRLEIKNLQIQDKPDLEKIKEKQAEYKTAIDNKKNFIDKYSVKPYTEKYYEKIKLLESNSKDSENLKRIKDLKKEILRLEEDQFKLFVLDTESIDEAFEIVTERISKLQTEVEEIRANLSKPDLKIFELLEELFEEDKIKSDRIRVRHKYRWMNQMKDLATERGNPRTGKELEEYLEDMYIGKYMITNPNQKYWDEIKRLKEKEDELANRDTDSSAVLVAIDLLKEKKKEILKAYENVRGKTSVSSFKYNIETAKSIKELEGEIEKLYKRLRIYTIIKDSNGSTQEKETMRTYMDLIFSFSKIIEYVNIPSDTVIKMFEPYITLTLSEADYLKQVIDMARIGDNSGLEELKTKNFEFVNDTAKKNFKLLLFNVTDINSILNLEDIIVDGMRLSRTSNKNYESLKEIRNERAGLASRAPSMDYIIVFGEFVKYVEDYVKNSEQVTDVHINKVKDFKPDSTISIEDIEGFLGDGLYEATIRYLDNLAVEEATTKSGYYPLAEYIEFINAIHKVKSLKNGYTFTPADYVRELVVSNEYSDKKYPKFLTKSKVKDEYNTEKINELDSRVISGSEQPTVDINGRWLPKYDQPKGSPYYDQRYHDLKKDNPEAFKLLQNLTFEYLTAQVNSTIPEGSRPDTVIPVKYLDNLEKVKQDFTDGREWLNRVKNLIPSKNLNEGVEEELRNTQEELGTLTVENRNLYSGALIEEDQVKLRALRNVPIQRTSKDVTASIALFIEEIEEFEAKNYVNPIFQSFRDVFEYTNKMRGEKVNKYRAEIVTDLQLTKILEQAPKNFANNPYLAGVLQLMTKFAVMRLMADPLGAMVNLGTGTIQSIIESAFDPKEYKMYLASNVKASEWLVKYDKDFYRQATWSRETQLINIFNMIPEKMGVAKHLSQLSLASDIKAKLMAPRSETEKFMAIQLGLGILMANSVDFNGKKYNIEDLYMTDPVTNLVKLKPEFSSLEEQWNPENGTQVKHIRKIIMQKYTLLQGNFYKINQSYASETALGRAGELMKRWFVSGVIRRFQGEVIDPFTGESRKGFHTAMLQMLWNMIKDIPKGNFAEFNDKFTNIHWGLKSEQIAIRRSASEMLAIAIFGVITSIILGYDDDDPDKNKKLKESTIWKQWAILVSMRIQGELGTFIPVPVWGLGYMEMKRAVLDPFGVLTSSGFNNVAAVFKLLVMQGLYETGADSYEKDLYYSKDLGYNSELNQLIGFKQKGGSKLWSMIWNTVGYVGYTADPAPYINTISNMQNRVK